MPSMVFIGSTVLGMVRNENRFPEYEVVRTTKPRMRGVRKMRMERSLL